MLRHSYKEKNVLLTEWDKDYLNFLKRERDVALAHLGPGLDPVAIAVWKQYAKGIDFAIAQFKYRRRIQKGE
jgi:hypothetical protein